MPLMIHQQTIDQLGGAGMLRMMLRATEFEMGENSLRFRFKGSRKYTLCEIVLDGSDTYTVRFGKAWGEWTSETSGVFCDMLQGVFEETTGLLTSMKQVTFGYG